MTLHFEGPEVVADDYRDKVCVFNTSFCIPEYAFLGIKKEKNLAGIDGMVGLAPDFEDPENGPSILEGLKKGAYID
jgi:hypothetical protein